jgi:hypothetical protein
MLVSHHALSPSPIGQLKKPGTEHLPISDAVASQVLDYLTIPDGSRLACVNRSFNALVEVHTQRVVKRSGYTKEAPPKDISWLKLAGYMVGELSLKYAPDGIRKDSEIVFCRIRKAGNYVVFFPAFVTLKPQVAVPLLVSAKRSFTDIDDKAASLGNATSFLYSVPDWIAGWADFDPGSSRP